MSSSARARRGGGGWSFPVGRRRYVPVVDTGCGCRPRMLLSLPSFLRSSYSTASKPAAPAARSATPSLYSSSSSFFPSSSSTASFSSSSNCSNYYSSAQAPAAAAVVKRQPLPSMKKTKRRYYVEEKKAAAAPATEEEEEEVGVAVEKESSDPRADFRESMVQMVVETGLCGWDDLRCMLRRLLALNAPRHHAAILTAFAELCAQLAAPPPPPPPASYQYQYQR